MKWEKVFCESQWERILLLCYNVNLWHLIWELGFRTSNFYIFFILSDSSWRQNGNNVLFNTELFMAALLLRRWRNKIDYNNGDARNQKTIILTKRKARKKGKWLVWLITKVRCSTDWRMGIMLWHWLRLPSPALITGMCHGFAEIIARVAYILNSPRSRTSSQSNLVESCIVNVGLVRWNI